MRHQSINFFALFSELLKTIGQSLVRSIAFKEPIKLIKAGRILLSKNLSAKAIEKFSEAISKAPNYSGGYTWRALALNLDGQSEQALADFDKAISLTTNQQDNLVHYLSRASVQLDIEHYPEAVADCDLVIDLCKGRVAKNTDIFIDFGYPFPEPDVLIDAYACRAKAYEKLGEMSLAKESLDACSQALKAQPTARRGLTDHSPHYMKLENWDGAIQCCNSVLKLNSRNASAYNNRGWAYLQIGEYSLALSDLDCAIGIDSTVAAFYDTRGRIYEKLGKNDLAVKDKKRAQELGLKTSI